MGSKVVAARVLNLGTRGMLSDQLHAPREAHHSNGRYRLLRHPAVT
jgi:hypothetical protein